MNRLNWRKNLTEALNEIHGGSRLPLLFFYRQDCEGSLKTLNEVMTDDKVVSAIERETAPVMVDIEQNQDLAREYRVDWTPAFIICDEDGKELERWVGFLPSEDFIPQITLSKGLAAFHLGRHDEAIREFEMILDEHAGSELVPEAEYFLGASTFKLTGETEKLTEICHDLVLTHPDSPWTKRCTIWGRQSNYLRPFVGYDGGGSAGSGAY